LKLENRLSRLNPNFWGKNRLSRLSPKFWDKNVLIEPAQPKFLGKIGRDTPTQLEFLCDNPSESAHLDRDLEMMAKGKRGTIKQHNNKSIGNNQNNINATVQADLLFVPNVDM